MSGFFITLEGGEAAGKSTQAQLLADYLISKGRDVILTREPGGTAGAESIRELLMTGDEDRWSGHTEALLMYASRRDHTEKVIWPALAENKVVICDRYADSSMAYQGYARGVGRRTLARLHKAVLGDFQPDLTLIFDLELSISRDRLEARNETRTRFETTDETFHKAIRQAFLDIAKRNKSRCRLVYAGGTIDEVQEQIQLYVNKALKGA